MKKSHLIKTSYKESVIVKLLPFYVKEVAQDIENLVQSFKEGNLEGVKFGAHKIKGSSKCYGAHFIQQKAIDIEELLMGDKDNALSKAVESLRLEILEFKEVMNDGIDKLF
ncbi:MAG: Hpt domain-containing protein [Flavobacteriales bacterium]|nr:Hpt domain-containing protein [Flavobacteriales bacterium]